MIEMRDKVASGYLTVTKKYSDGAEEIVVDNEKNAITMSSRRYHLSFLHKQSAVIDLLSSFKIGIGGTVDPDGKLPIVPDPTLNDLYSPIPLANDSITIIESSPTDDSEVYIEVIFTIAQDEANGLRIDECGVFKERGDMFNIKTFRAIEKTESFSLVFNWRILYV
tara:strand:- start:1106 stop:1603 length:498 start_codon:yes stop_codon:yes gene_type:complete